MTAIGCKPYVQRSAYFTKLNNKHPMSLIYNKLKLLQFSNVLLKILPNGN